MRSILESEQARVMESNPEASISTSNSSEQFARGRAYIYIYIYKTKEQVDGVRDPSTY